MEKNNNKNNQENKESPAPKKRFNWTLFVQISSIVVFAACFAYMIYQVVAFDEADMWIPIICLTIAVLVAFSFFKEKFWFSEKGFRNRIILYIVIFAVLAVPNAIGNVVLYFSGRYKNDEMFMELVNEGNTPSGVLGVTIGAEILTFAFLAAIIIFIIEMSMRQSIKRATNKWWTKVLIYI